MEKLRSQQNLALALGVERVRIQSVSVQPLEDPTVKVAFCTTALRCPTVYMALIIIIAWTWKRRDAITWHVVDSSEDMELTNTLIDVLESAIRCGHLKLDRSSELKYWHACIAKNTAHTGADEPYHVLCHVDGDNLPTLGFVEQCLQIAQRIKKHEVAC